MSEGQIVTCTYRVAVEAQEEYLGLLVRCEEVMMGEGLITDRPFVRMRSKADPTILVEIFEWVDGSAFERAQENPRVLEMWGKYAALWQDGGFGLDQIPESKVPWAQFDPVP